MRCMLVAGGALAVGCLGSTPREPTMQAARLELEPRVAAESWYRAAAICGQGPYELEVPVAGARWGEEVALRVATPRRIALHAVIVADDEDVAKAAAVYDGDGEASGAAENTRCVADLRERRAASRGGAGSIPPPGTPAEPGVRVRTPDDPPPRELAVTGRLELDRGAAPPASIELIRHGWRTRERGGEPRRFARIRIRIWSIEPNDLEGVWFGVRRTEWRPPGTDAEYEAYLARIAAEDEARRRRQEEELRRRAAEEEARRRREPAPRTRPAPSVELDAEAELARSRAQEEARRRRAAERAAERAAAVERKRRREAFCAAHPEDRGCWGAGGMRVHLQLDERARARERYCAAHREDARCWSAGERRRREVASRRRVEAALAPPAQPEGPPPAALAEEIPPKLSANAEWRPGYWQWTGKDWAWLAGMWRVPERDIAAEQTTLAPEPPPPPRTEPVPPPPMAAAIWVGGFWQWSGDAWIWVAGSWQARPDAGAAWRPAEWRPRGAVHVLIPGGWIRVRGGGR